MNPELNWQMLVLLERGVQVLGGEQTKKNTTFIAGQEASQQSEESQELSPESNPKEISEDKNESCGIKGGDTKKVENKKEVSEDSEDDIPF